ncbi:MAG: flagellar biosynthesis protein FlhF [Hydrogenophilaceae bacterium]|nr:flagellar biosynthesis protein FlhF [Hydrogenophilaceae bacterium]
MIKKFHAGTTRDALRQVRDALGANAIILSNRRIEGGVEIIAVADMDVAALSERAEPVVSARPARPQPTPAPRKPSAQKPMFDEVAITTLTEYLAQREAPQAPAKEEAAEAAAPPPAPAAPAQAEAPAAAEVPPVMQELAREMRLLRSMVEGQLAGFAWSDLTRREPLRAELMKLLIGAGFGTALCNHLIEQLPEGYDLARAEKWLKATLMHNIKIAQGDQDIVNRGGVYALVGPTGVGKTTTVAKLAARAVLKYGADQVALITTDTYRIGAQDQLRIYGRILGTPVYAVRDAKELDLTLADLANKKLVLIDTVGMGQRDKRVAEQVDFLSGHGRRVKRLLLLGAPAQGMTLEEVVRAYSGEGLEGCILTKIDEALTYGPVLDVVLRHQLLVHYVTNGQRVPEDLHLANLLYLVDRAFKLNQPDSPFTLDESDIPVLVAAERAVSAIDPSNQPQGAVGAVR